MSKTDSQSRIIVANDLTLSEQQILISKDLGVLAKDILVAVLPKIPVQFYLLPSVQSTVQQQHDEYQNNIRQLGKCLGICDEQQVLLDADFWQSELIQLAEQNQIKNVLLGKKWSSLLYLNWWYKRHGIRLQIVAEAKHNESLSRSIAA